MIAKRECGLRIAGGVYLEVPTTNVGGRPIEYFLTDPPIPIDLEELGLTSVGTKMFERNGTWHVFDVVGEDSYPNVADFIEEARRYGISRRIARTVDFFKITLGSTLTLIHRRAYLDNWDELASQASGYLASCPTGKHMRYEISGPCARWHWMNVEGAEGGRRQLETFDYPAHAVLDGLKIQYRPAIFAVFPVTKVAVIRDPEGGTHKEIFERVEAQVKGIPVVLEDE